MEPRIQYAKTEDGVSIAYWTIGNGFPIVHMVSIPFSHVRLESRGGYQGLYEKIVAKRKLIRLDPRGFGMSDREVERFSLDTWLQDMEAVVGRLGLETFALSALYHSCPLAIAYAARHPEQVSHLVVMDSAARVADTLATPQAQSLADMLIRDWEMFSENLGGLFFGWGREDAVKFGEFVRACVTPETARHAFAALARVDVTKLLPRVTAPTLVIHHSGIKIVTQDMARGLVAGIPDARLLIIDGVYSFDWEREVRAIDEFLAEGEEAPPPSVAPEPGAFRTVLFTDVEGSTALTQRLGDARARELLREHERMVRDALKSHGGSEVKALGDGFMASFSSATKALECAIAMQRAFAEHNVSAEEPILVRIGLNAGEPIAEDDPDGRSDLFGTAVNEAARITATAKGGEILVSDVVRQLVKGKDFLFSDVGERQLKGFDEPVRLFEVGWREER
jgi:class 3 adenylate cyclase/pimeloyl-ACP methyl ester carboxylesterase